MSSLLYLVLFISYSYLNFYSKCYCAFYNTNLNYASFGFQIFINVHFVIYYACSVIKFCCFTFVCRSKSPTGLMLHCCMYSTQNKSSISMSKNLLCPFNIYFKKYNAHVLNN